LATWVGANSAGANVADHGSRRSPEVAITFDGISDPATLQRLVAMLDGSGTRATFFVPAPMLQTTAQVGTLLLKGHQQLANGADARDWGAWLDPNYSQLAHDQRVFARNLDVCPTFFRSTDGRTPPMMAAAVRRHRMTMVSADVRVSGRGDSARLVHQVLAHARSGSIIALRLDTDPPAKGATAKGTAAKGPAAKGTGAPTATSTVVDAVPAILQGLRVRGLQPVPLDQLLHLAPYTSRC
jgi:peptidoglycan/xylan/chitin deacetylase (PgdA/CDA1 family)